MVEIKRINWSEQSLQSFNNIYAYLLEGFGVESSDKFVEQLFNLIKLLKKFPSIGIKSINHPELRRIVLNEFVSVIYEINDDELIIHFVYDNRMNNPNFR